MSISDVAKSYAHPIVFLFFGGFIIALALEKVNLHRRIALSILKLTGTNADGVVLGFMLATALMSMWISNTASTVVMLPIALSVIKLLINDEDGFTKNDKNLSVVCSRSHLNEATQVFVNELDNPELITQGSSLKFLILAKT